MNEFIGWVLMMFSILIKIKINWPGYSLAWNSYILRFFICHKKVPLLLERDVG